jgi:hypothetical protein
MFNSPSVAVKLAVGAAAEMSCERKVSDGFNTTIRETTGRRLTSKGRGTMGGFTGVELGGEASHGDAVVL